METRVFPNHQLSDRYSSKIDRKVGLNSRQKSLEIYHSLINIGPLSMNSSKRSYIFKGKGSRNPLKLVRWKPKYDEDTLKLKHASL